MPLSGRLLTMAFAIKVNSIGFKTALGNIGKSIPGLFIQS